jgi:hypothetical protein
VYGNPYERGGYVPHWRALKDDSGRVQIAAFFNQDLGDAWEWADYPPYPEKLVRPGLAHGRELRPVFDDALSAILEDIRAAGAHIPRAHHAIGRSAHCGRLR